MLSVYIDCIVECVFVYWVCWLCVIDVLEWNIQVGVCMLYVDWVMYMCLSVADSTPTQAHSHTYIHTHAHISTMHACI